MTRHDTTRVERFLQAHPTQRYTAAQIARRLNANQSQVRSQLTKLYERKLVEHEAVKGGDLWSWCGNDPRER